MSPTGDQEPYNRKGPCTFGQYPSDRYRLSRTPAVRGRLIQVNAEPHKFAVEMTEPVQFALCSLGSTKGEMQNENIACVDGTGRRPIFYSCSGFGLDLRCNRSIGPHGNRFRHPD
jgi:hypothetical protein